MRAITVRQPWAWAIVHGGKDVENRTRNIAGGYRGPVAIHAGLAPDTAAQGHWPLGDLIPSQAWKVRGMFVGVVDLVDVHAAAFLEDDPWEWCCRPWGDPPGILMKADGKFTGPRQHLALANPRPLPVSVPCRGKLGLWTPPADVLDRLQTTRTEVTGL